MAIAELLAVNRMRRARSGARSSIFGSSWRLLCVLAVWGLPYAEALEEGDPCVLKGNIAGVCQTSSVCEPRVKKYIETKRLTPADIPRCGLSAFEEIVCCPAADCCEVDQRLNSGSINNPAAPKSDSASSPPFFEFNKPPDRPRGAHPAAPFAAQSGALQIVPNADVEFLSREQMRSLPAQQLNSNLRKPALLVQDVGPLGQPFVPNDVSNSLQDTPTHAALSEAPRQPAEGGRNAPQFRFTNQEVNEPRANGAGLQLNRDLPFYDVSQMLQEQLRAKQSFDGSFKQTDNSDWSLRAGKADRKSAERRILNKPLDILRPAPAPEMENHVEWLEPTNRRDQTDRWSWEQTPAPLPGGGFNVGPQTNDLLNVGTPVKDASTTNDTSSQRPAAISCQYIQNHGFQEFLTMHILDGIPVDPGYYPHMAAIGFDEFGTRSFRCGGSLISNRHVLTAAHCVNNQRPAFVRLGTVNIESEGPNFQDIDITDNVVIHPDYNITSKYNDIAIMELAEQPKLSIFVFPACLELSTADPPSSAKIFVAGWGVMNRTTRRTSKILLHAPLSLVPLDQCNQSYAEQPSSTRYLQQGIKETLICAADVEKRTKDACQGDSGGPLTYERDMLRGLYSILGIISAGFGCATQTPGLYTRVASYLDFIESVVWPNNVVPQYFT